jgi:hypothetical protein
MKTRGRLVAAVGAGYLLRGWTAKLARSPEVARLGETIRGELMTSAKAAAVTAVGSGIDSLNSRLLAGGENLAESESKEAGTTRRSSENRGQPVVAAEEREDEPAGDESTENENVSDDRGRPDKEGETQAAETGETDKPETTEQSGKSEQGERPRRRSGIRRPRVAGTAKEIREWALQHGYDISSRGRIPANIEHAFRDAH